MHRNPLLFLAPIFAICLTFHFSGGEVQNLLVYQSSKVSGGEVWRFLSCHFVHTNNYHLWLNLAALVLLTYLLPVIRTVLEGYIVLVSSGILICLLYYFIYPQNINYLGLSGVLHSLAIVGAMRLLSQERTLALALIVLIVSKVIYENVFGASESMAELINANVAVESHLFGVIAGSLIALGLRWLNANRDEDLSV